MENEKISKKEANKLKKKEAKMQIKSENKIVEEDYEIDYSASKYGEFIINESAPLVTHVQHINKDFISKSVIIKGSLQNSRKTGKQVFVTIRQYVSTIQCVAGVSERISKKMVNFISSINRESRVFVKAVVVGVYNDKPIESCTQKYVELEIEEFYVVTEALLRLPFLVEDAMRPDNSELAKVNLDTKLNSRWIDLRTPANKGIFRIQDRVVTEFRNHLKEKGFDEIMAPKLISAASEGGAGVFQLPYFDETAYLAQSPQLYKQMMLNSGFEKVFTVGPVFRAENSNTHRHLTEFVGLDLEMEIEHDYHEALDVICETLLHIFLQIENKMTKELDMVKAQHGFEPFVYMKPTLVLDFGEGVKMLRQAGVEMGDYEDLTTTNEKLLGKLIKKKFNTDFYVLDKFPLNVRPFYTMADKVNPQLSNSYDIFMRGEEILSGGQRIHEATKLRENATKHGINLEKIQDYLESFDHGSPMHAGGGIGLERVTMLYLGLDNIRKASAWPRDPKRLRP